MSQLQFDADTARRIEALYRIRDAVHRRELVREALGAVLGDRILDAGCGPGFYCLELSAIVGSSGSVVGVDSSPAMLQLASVRCAGRDNVVLLEGEATALPVESGAFDGAVCVQVLEYVADVDAALAELHRALRPGGRAVVWDVDWATVSIHSRDTALTTRVLRAWDEHLADRSLPRTLGARLRSAGFEDVRVEAHAFAASGRDPETIRRGARAVHRDVRRGQARHRRGGGRGVGRGAARADGTRRVLLREHAVLLHSHESRLAAPEGQSIPRERCVRTSGSGGRPGRVLPPPGLTAMTIASRVCAGRLPAAYSVTSESDHRGRGRHSRAVG